MRQRDEGEVDHDRGESAAGSRATLGSQAAGSRAASGSQERLSRLCGPGRARGRLEQREALAWYSKAADYYEQFARRFPGEPGAPDALQNAIVFRVGRGEHERAVEDALLFARSYGKRPRYAARAAAVHFALAQLPEARGDVEAT